MVNKCQHPKMGVEIKTRVRRQEMKIVCAWCGKDMGEKDSKGVDGVTHSICKECSAKLMTKVESKIWGDENTSKL